MVDLQAKCVEVRKALLKTIGTLGVGHIGGSLDVYKRQTWYKSPLPLWWD